MSDSLVFVHSRSNDLYIFDPDEIPRNDDLAPIMQLAAAVINRGYKGVAIDELKLKNGRYVHSMEADIATPEGQVIQKLARAYEDGRQLAEVVDVLEAIERLYMLRKLSTQQRSAAGRT